MSSHSSIAFLAAIAAAATISTAAAPARAQAPGLHVDGRVVASSTGTPLAGARVEVVGTALATTTGSDGTFAMALPGRRAYELRVVLEGFDIATVAASAGAGPPVEIRLTPRPVTLHETVVVTARRDEAPLYSVPRSLSVVPSVDLARRMPRTAPEALVDTAGVFVQKTNHGGGSPIIRGLVGNQVLVLVDGIRLNNSTFRYGPNQYLTTIDPRQIERVEVLRGAGSVLFGSDALGGVVNIVTRKPQLSPEGTRTSGSASAKLMTGGMEQSGRLDLAVEHTRAAVRGGVSVNNFGDLRAGGSLGVEAPSGYSSVAGDLTGLVRLSPRHLLTVGWQSDYQADVPRFDQVAQRGYSRYAFDPQTRLLGYTRLQYLAESRWFRTVTATASVQRSRERRERQVRGSSTLVTEQDTVRVLGASVEVRSAPGHRWTAVSGIDLYQDEVGSWRKDVNQASGAVTARRGLYPDGSGSLTAAVFSQASLSAGRIDVDLGARYSHVRVTADDPLFGRLEVTPDSLVGSLAASLEVVPGWRVLGSLTQGFRAPNLDDMSALGAFDYGIEVPSPGLNPERSLGFELGVHLRRERLSASAAAYRTNLDDLIDRVRSTFGGSENYEGQRVYRRENVGSAFVRGVEAQAEWRVAGGIEWFGHVTYTYGQQTTASQPMRRIPPVNGLTGIRWIHPSGALVEAALRAAGAQRRLSSGDKDDYRVQAGGTPGWQTVDLRLDLPVAGRFHLSAALQNLFDEAYRIHGSGIDGVGRSAWVGMRTAF